MVRANQLPARLDSIIRKLADNKDRQTSKYSWQPLAVSDSVIYREGKKLAESWLHKGVNADARRNRNAKQAAIHL